MNFKKLGVEYVNFNDIPIGNESNKNTTPVISTIPNMNQQKQTQTIPNMNQPKIIGPRRSTIIQLKSSRITYIF